MPSTNRNARNHHGPTHHVLAGHQRDVLQEALEARQTHVRGSGAASRGGAGCGEAAAAAQSSGRQGVWLG